MHGYTFSEGFANVLVGRRWGFIDTGGDMVIPAVFEDSRPFCGGVAAVKQDGLWGFVNSDGEMVLIPQFDSVSDRINNMVRVWSERERATFYFNIDEGTIISPTLISSASTLRFTIGSNNFFRNETVQQAEVAPFISQGRTMIPLRIIAEALGAKVDWNNATRTVIITGREETINLTVDVPLPGDMGTPVFVNGFTFVPVRYVSETLGATVRWDGENNAVYIYGT
jgi:hypothetical protein